MITNLNFFIYLYKKKYIDICAWLTSQPLKFGRRAGDHNTDGTRTLQTPYEDVASTFMKPESWLVAETIGDLYATSPDTEAETIGDLCATSPDTDDWSTLEQRSE